MTWKKVKGTTKNKIFFQNKENEKEGKIDFIRVETDFWKKADDTWYVSTYKQEQNRTNPEFSMDFPSKKVALLYAKHVMERYP